MAGTVASRRIRGLGPDERQAQRRRQLLDAALDHFARRGFAGTSIEQLCQAAYVGTKGFYELFDSKEACYLAMLRHVSDSVRNAVADAWADAPSDEVAATAHLVARFVAALLDDPRVALVTFGHASGISPLIEAERRANRRAAAAFVVSVWQRFDGASDAAPSARPAYADRTGAGDHVPVPPSGRPGVAGDRRYPAALGLIGGLFELVADWLAEHDPGSPTDRARLVADCTAFAGAVRAGARPAPA